MAEALMISRLELRQRAMRQRVALGALEKDYILVLILERIYSDPTWHETLVFKGGTALNKVYKTQRLSLDLDFTAQRPVSVDALRPALEIPEIQGQIKDVHEYHDALTIDRLGFVGPLQHPNSIKVDISLREKVQVPPRQVLVDTPYDLSFTVTCMALEEILAEKIRATLMRRTPRDYYDLWFLLQREDIDLKLLPDLLRVKLQTVERPYDPQELWTQIDILRRLWNDDLRQLLSDVPPFEDVFLQLRALFESKLPSTL
jgi:predicted nucleotidyltransferase component of viral defense system